MKYCDRCGKMQPTHKLEEKTEIILKTGEKYSLEYEVDVCDVCGDVLCREDADKKLEELGEE